MLGTRADYLPSQVLPSMCAQVLSCRGISSISFSRHTRQISSVVATSIESEMGEPIGYLTDYTQGIS